MKEKNIFLPFVNKQVRVFYNVDNKLYTYSGLLKAVSGSKVHLIDIRAGDLLLSADDIKEMKLL